jgi:16S rRNA (uracil1498-N3)-methyltransferase
MSTPRVFTTQSLVIYNSIELESSPSHHISRVLRLKNNAKLLVFNGDGYEYLATIQTIHKSIVTVLLAEKLHPVRESELRISLGQGISRGERMDYSLQKSVELGITRITPIWTQRSQVKLAGTRLEKRLIHWRGIIRSACEQSGRLILPELESPITLEKWCRDDKTESLKLILDPAAKQKLGDMKPSNKNLTILIGPEGGFDDNELVAASAQGFIKVSLGPRILRTETATIAALSALQTLWGDLG